MILFLPKRIRVYVLKSELNFVGNSLETMSVLYSLGSNVSLKKKHW